MSQRISEQNAGGGPKVSVAMITYNHEPFIAQAIESVLMQKTDFPFELVIGEDCSTDGTRKIVQEYADQYPNVIRAILQETNQGMMKNALIVLDRCRGEYSAFLEGDDFWTSPGKLMKQVGFLNQYPECSMCFHDVAVVYEDKSSAESYPMKVRKPRYTLVDLLRGDLQLATNSVMLRSDLFKFLPDWYFTLGVGDYSMFVLAAERGDIGFIDERMGVYRVHRGGVWSNGVAAGDWSPAIAARNSRTFVGVWNAVNTHLNYKYDYLLRDRVALLHYDLVWYERCLGNWPEMRRELWLALKTKFPHPKIRMSFIVKSAIIAALPAIYTAYRSLINSGKHSVATEIPKK